jgi:hypothetical protein
LHVWNVLSLLLFVGGACDPVQVHYNNPNLLKGERDPGEVLIAVNITASNCILQCACGTCGIDEFR